MKIVFLGTPDFAVGVLKKLIESDHRVVAVVAQPDRAKDRKGNLISVPVKAFALQNGIDVYQFDRIKDEGSVEALKSLDCDVFVTAAYGQILSREILDIPHYGVFNVHASLLPRYRGASPVQSALLNGDRETGVTIMRTEEGLDTGNIISYRKMEIGVNDNAEVLLATLSQVGGELAVETLYNMEKGLISEVKQDESMASKCRLLTKKDGQINWNSPNYVTHNQARALILWPTAYTSFSGKSLKIFVTELCEKRSGFEPGQVIEADDCGIIVACGEGGIRIKQLQIEGKNRMSAADFVRGYRIKRGDFFGK